MIKNSGKYVPYSWKALYALLKGINDGEILSKDRIDKWLNKMDFEVLVYNVFREVFCTPITNFPREVIDFQDETSGQMNRPSVSTLDILTDLETAAQKISSEYKRYKESPQKTLKKFDIPKVNVSEECRRVIDIVTQYKQYQQDPYAVFDKFQNKIYTIDGTPGSYPILAGAFTPDLVYDENLDDFVIKTERDWHIVMKKSCGMSAYAFMIATMRNDDDNCTDLDVISWENYPHKDMPTIWVGLYESSYYSKLLKPDIEEDDKQLLSEFLLRPVFSDIFSPIGLNKCNAEPYPYNHIIIHSHIADIEKDRNKRLTHLMNLVMKESQFLLKNRNIIKKLFICDEEAKEVWEDKKMRHLLFEQSIDGLDDYYIGNEIENVSLLLYDWSLGLDSEYLLSKPLLCDETVLNIVDNCIEADLDIKGIIKTIMDEDKQFSYVSAPTTAGTDEMKNLNQCIIKAREKGFIDRRSRLLGPLSQLTDFLVSHGYVKNRNGGWDVAFLRDGKKYFEEGKKDKEFIRQCLEDLDWEPFDKIFERDQKKIRATELRKAFSDHRKEKVEKTFKCLYYHLGSQHDQKSNA